MYDKANQLYHNKNYDSALQLYQQMINDGYCYADLFYNAGNAYYRINKIGLSIWCYEKALKVHYDRNYAENLELAKTRIREPIPGIEDIFFIKWWKSLYGFFSVNKWAVLALSSFLIAFFILFLKKLRGHLYVPKRLIQSLFAVSGYSLFMTLAAAYQQTYNYSGIIIEPQTLIRFQSKKEPIFISEGIKVQVVNDHLKNSKTGGADYIMVELPDGREGMIDRKSFKRL